MQLQSRIAHNAAPYNSYLMHTYKQVVATIDTVNLQEIESAKYNNSANFCNLS